MPYFLFRAAVDPNANSFMCSRWLCGDTDFVQAKLIFIDNPVLKSLGKSGKTFILL